MVGSGSGGRSGSGAGRFGSAMGPMVARMKRERPRAARARGLFSSHPAGGRDQIERAYFFFLAGFLAAGVLAAGFLAAGFLAAGFLAAGFLAAGFFSAFFLRFWPPTARLARE